MLTYLTTSPSPSPSPSPGALTKLLLGGDGRMLNPMAIDVGNNHTLNRSLTRPLYHSLTQEHTLNFLTCA